MVTIFVGISLSIIFYQKLKKNFRQLSIIILSFGLILSLAIGLFTPTNYKNSELLCVSKLSPVSIENDQMFAIEYDKYFTVNIANLQKKNDSDTKTIDKENVEIIYGHQGYPQLFVYSQQPSLSLWSFSLIKIPKIHYELYIPENSLSKEF